MKTNTKCSECNEKVCAKGLCKRHYNMQHKRKCRELREFIRHQKAQIKEQGRYLILVILFFLASNAYAVYPVYDAPLHIQTAYDQVVNYAKQCAQYIKQCDQWIEEHTSALKEVESVENQVLQMSRMGSMTSVMHLPGVRNLQTAGAIYGQWRQNVAIVEGYANPQGFQGSVQQILGAYQQPFTQFGYGGYGSSVQGLFQFEVSDYNTLSGAQQQIQQLMDKKASLKADLDAANAAMESASDNTTQMKYHAQIVALSAGIAQIDAQISNTKSATELQIRKNQAARMIYQAQVQQQTAAGYSNEVTRAINDAKSIAPQDMIVPQWPQGQ